MLYKAFAAVTLVAAPIIVLIVQGLAPHAPAQSASAPAPLIVQQAAPMPQQAPAPSIEQPPEAPMPFGQPMPDAGKPFLSPRNGLPGGSPSADAEAANNVADAGSDTPQN